MYSINIERKTLGNKLYRNVLHTTPNMQLVVMSLEKGETIPLEKHEGSQFIRVESGRGVAKTPKKKVLLKEGVSIIIPPNTPHFIYQTGDEPLKLYTVYAPPEHREGVKKRRV